MHDVGAHGNLAHQSRGGSGGGAGEARSGSRGTILAARSEEGQAGRKKRERKKEK